MRIRDFLLPGIVRQLLIAQRQAFLILIDFEDHGVDLLTLLEDFRRVFDVLGPRHIGNMDQTVHPFIETDKGAEVRQAFDFSLDLGSHRIFRFNKIPRIRGDLLHAERDFPGGFVHIQHLGFHDVSDRNDLRGVSDFVGPRHLRDMHESLDAGLQFDESAVIGEAHHTSLDPCSDGALGRHAHPRVRALLFQSQRDASRLAVIAQHHDFDAISHHAHL